MTPACFIARYKERVLHTHDLAAQHLGPALASVQAAGQGAVGIGSAAPSGAFSGLLSKGKALFGGGRYVA